MADMGSVPDWIAVALTVAGGAGAVAARRNSRVGQLRELVEEASGMAAGQVLHRMEESPELEEVMTRAIEAAAITAHDEKRRALAKVIASGLHDDALVDEALMMVRAIDAIDPPHIRALLELASSGLTDRSIPRAVWAHLRSQGLVDERRSGGVSVLRGQTLTYGWRMSDFGRRLLEHLGPT